MGEIRTTKGDAPPLPAKERRWKTLCTSTLIFVITGVLLGAGFLIRMTHWIPASGYVTTFDYAEVRTPAPAQVSRILAFTGTTVKAGDLLVDLDKGESQAELEEARSRSQKNAADLERLRLDAVEAERQHRQALTKALAQYEYSAARLTRTRELLAKGLVAGSALEDDQLKDKLAESDLRTLEKRDLATFQRQIEVLQRELEAGEKTITKLEARLRTKEIRAPIAGQILRYEFVPGQMVTPDQVLMEIFGGPMVLKARIPERDASRLRPGQHYRARLTSYGNLLRRVWFHGRIDLIRNVIQAEGNVSYRVAYCTFENPDSDHRPVPPGTTALVEIDGGKVNFWIWLFGLD